ncbi:hypothetical protein CF326_g5337 [Tilletia indica]|nr:hypothetical protein CF326_g5337 [Tilletia indica]
MSGGQSAGQHRITPASTSRRPSLVSAITTDISLLTSTMMRTTQSAATSPTHELHLHRHIIPTNHSRSSRSAPTSPRLPIRTPLDNDQHTITAHFAHRGLYVRRVKRGSSFTPLDDPHGSSSTLVSDQQNAAISGRHSYAAPSREYQQHLHSLILSPPTSTRSSSSTRRGRTTPSSLTATPEASDGEEEEETEEMDMENTGSRAHQHHHHYRSTTPRRSHARQSSSTSSSGSALGLLRHTSDTPSSFKQRSPNSPFSSGSGEEEADQSLPHLSPSSSLSSMHSSSLGSASGTNSSSFSAQQHESPASSLYHDPALPMGSRERKVGVGVVSAFPPVVDVIAPSPPTPHSNPQRTQHARPITTGPTAGQRFVDGMHAYEQSLGGGPQQQGYPPRPSLGGPSSSSSASATFPSSRTKRRVSFDLNARARSHQPGQVYQQQQQQQQQVDVLLRDATAVEEEDIGLRRRNVGSGPPVGAGSRTRRPRTMSALPDLSVGESKGDGHQWASHSLRPLPPQEQQRWTTSDSHSGPSSPAWIQQQDESSKMRGRFGRAPSAHHHHRPSPSPSPSRSPLPIPRSGSRSAPTSRRPSSQALDELFQSDAVLRSRRHPHPQHQHVRLAADEEDIEGVYGRGSTGGSGSSLAAAADMGANAGARARAFFSGLGLGSGSHAEQVQQEGGGGGADPAVPRGWEAGPSRVGRRPVSSAAPAAHTGSWGQFREGESRSGYHHPSRPFGASSTTAASSNPRGTTFEHTYESLYGTQHHLVSAGNALAGAQIMSEEALLRTMSVAQMQLASAGNLALTLTRQLSEPLRPMFHVALLIGISSFTLLSLIAFMSVGYGLSIWDDVSSRAGSVASNPSAGVLRASARKNVEASVRWGKRMLAGSLESAFVLGWGSAALDESINGAASASASASASAGEGDGGEKGKSAFESGKTVPPPPPPGGPGFSRASGGRRMRTGSMPSHVPWAAMHAQNVPSSSSSSTPGGSGGTESKDKPAPPTSSDEYDFHSSTAEGPTTFPPRPPLTVLIPSIMLTLLIAVGASLVRMFIQRQQQQQQQKVGEEKGEASSTTTRREAGRRRYERERERGERPMRSREQRREEDRSRPSTANQDLRRPSGSGSGSHRRTRTASSAGMGRAGAAAGRQQEQREQREREEQGQEEEEVLDEDELSISLYRRGGSVRAH